MQSSYYNTLDALTTFIKEYDEYKIKTYFINSHNKCYYVEIINSQKKSIYLNSFRKTLLFNI
jgi:hypothetical protein